MSIEILKYIKKLNVCPGNSHADLNHTQLTRLDKKYKNIIRTGIEVA